MWSYNRYSITIPVLKVKLHYFSLHWAFLSKVPFVVFCYGLLVLLLEHQAVKLLPTTENFISSMPFPVNQWPSFRTRQRTEIWDPLLGHFYPPELKSYLIMLEIYTSPSGGETWRRAARKMAAGLCWSALRCSGSEVITPLIRLRPGGPYCCRWMGRVWSCRNRYCKEPRYSSFICVLCQLVFMMLLEHSSHILLIRRVYDWGSSPLLWKPCRQSWCSLSFLIKSRTKTLQIHPLGPVTFGLFVSQSWSCSKALEW